jgi:enoyl-CoA hydratase/carnithine racemase
MAELFNYSTFETNLDSKTKSLTVTFSNDPRLGLERLFELESLFSWLTTRVEISSVLFESGAEEFLGDWSHHSEKLSDGYIKKITTKVKALSYGMLHLPQTIVVDLGQKAYGLAVEFSIGADIRIARAGTKVKFNHLELGLTPAAGSLSVLHQIVSPALVRNWIMTGNDISQDQLTCSGFVSQFYDETQKTDSVSVLLSNINKQAQVQRIQTKFALLEPIRLSTEVLSPFEDSIFRASLVNQDWKNLCDQDHDFMPSKSFSGAVKMSDVQRKKETPQTNEKVRLADVMPFKKPENRPEH